MLDKEWFINKINSFLREDESNKIPIYSCGLCQVNVSCSDGIPLKK